MLQEAGIHELSAEEMAFVSGGVDAPTGSTSGGTSPNNGTTAQTGGCYYYEVGATLGIGMGIYGSTCGDFGMTWNAGAGAYATVGYADSSQTASSQIGQDGYVIGGTVDGSIQGDTGYVEGSIGAGIYAKDSDADDN